MLEIPRRSWKQHGAMIRKSLLGGFFMVWVLHFVTSIHGIARHNTVNKP
ncbi:hypothetical protein GAGA_0537 [Paraglaciecola agarilytica NO2]|uniref:Uncharacterized protein n=1 Tax=Paraglaciecola agarilytica NO2 TaxID=1125747 RepID=A0ABQ0I274_9ALTE|nr:hypothetical protein GAGA_0537 [Paraglaciecola agarilytica NO2]